MRNRHLFLFVTVLFAAFLAVGCGARQLTKGEIDQFDGISAKIAKAERMGAMECSPKELANAKVELDYARHEASEPWETAQPFIKTADKAADDLLAKTTPCWEAKQVKPAPPMTVTVPMMAPVPAPKAEVKFIVLDDVHFDFDKSTLTKEGVEVMERNIRVLKENPETKVRVAGYTSASGTEDYNQKLSERRAKTVEDYLIKEGGIAPERLTKIGYGEKRPVTYEPIPEDINSKAAKANMRVLFEVIVK